MKRVFDLFFGILLLVLLFLPMIIISLIICFISKDSVLYWSDRIGQNNKIFKMPKFRTMKKDVPTVATHLLVDSDSYLLPIGSFLRRTSLDESPQIFSVLKGDMSLVGPRPALFNQNDLIALRTKKGVDKLLPGITGLAQVSGRDNLSIANKVAADVEYLNRKSFWFDVKILFMTFLKVIRCGDISH